MEKQKEMIKELVKEKRVKVSQAIESMGMRRSTFYYRIQGREKMAKAKLDTELVERLRNLCGYELVYGYRKATKLFGIYNHKKVYRHMSVLKMLQPKKLKKKKHKRLSISCPTKQNIRWEADFTYVYDGERMNYLSVVQDCYDKEIIGEHYGLRCRADEAIASLEQAVLKRFGSLEHSCSFRVIMRIDQGNQYISKRFRQRACELGVKLEYCGINCPDDKPYVECFFARYKCEEVYRNEYRNFIDGKNGWKQYLCWYNSVRIHQGLGWKSINQFRAEKGFFRIDKSPRAAGKGLLGDFSEAGNGFIPSTNGNLESDKIRPEVSQIGSHFLSKNIGA